MILWVRFFGPTGRNGIFSPVDKFLLTNLGINMIRKAQQNTIPYFSKLFVISHLILFETILHLRQNIHLLILLPIFIITIITVSNWQPGRRIGHFVRHHQPTPINLETTTYPCSTSNSPLKLCSRFSSNFKVNVSITHWWFTSKLVSLLVALNIEIQVSWHFDS